ncbi:MAG: SMC-Scp complex subunit ScpB [Candidatus Pacebacteria bacterium]|nr:SMC-Scp complex subunit ScpB [Candidatus Paceibacterota bacterium]
MKLSLPATIEGLLYYKGQSVTVQEIVKILGVPESDVRTALDTLGENLRDRGLSLVMHQDHVELCTHSELSDLITRLQKEELEKPLSKPSIETLAIIAYGQGVARSEIDYIRGVNSAFIVRSLEVRGLVEKKTHPEDKRVFLYYPTLDFLKSMGLENTEQLPEYVSFQDKIAALQEGQNDAESA